MSQEARARLESDLRGAIACCAIEPYYQPLVTLRDRRIAGFEILSRWDRPGHGMVAPDRFIAVAEKIGLMHDLTGCVLRRACRDVRNWPGDISLSLNVSPPQIQDRALPGRVLSILGETGFPASRLEIEVTETALVTDLAAARAVLRALSDAGASAALDDFGTGYSGFHHLRELKFDRIKIDRSFIRSMDCDKESMRMIDFILAVGGRRGLSVTAEGVEKPGHAAWLARHGCQQGQGSLFGSAMPAEKVTCLLRENRNRRWPPPEE